MGLKKSKAKPQKSFKQRSEQKSVYFDQLFALAKKSQANAHSPYSGFKVGAAIVTEDNEFFGGCNIENASYGGTVCAERVAIWKGVSSSGKMKIKEILVLSPGDLTWPPCGMCRQVIAEFCTEKTVVHLCNPTKKFKTLHFQKDIFPHGFAVDFLKN